MLKPFNLFSLFWYTFFPFLEHLFAQACAEKAEKIAYLQIRSRKKGKKLCINTFRIISPLKISEPYTYRYLSTMIMHSKVQLFSFFQRAFCKTGKKWIKGLAHKIVHFLVHFFSFFGTTFLVHFFGRDFFFMPSEKWKKVNKKEKM